jgi:hypothetical protein
MSLLSRVVAATECSCSWCHEPRVADAELCREHLTDFWGHRIRRQSDGTYLSVIGPHVRLQAKDTTGWAA